MIENHKPLRILVVSLVDFNNSVHSRPHQLVDYLCRYHEVTALCMNAWWLAKTDGSVFYNTQSYYRGHLTHLKENLHMHYLDKGRHGAVYQEIFSWRAINTLLNDQESGDFDVIINSNTLITGYYLGRKPLPRRIPMVFDIADDIPAMVSMSPHLPPLARPLARPLAGWFFRKNVEKASRITYITHALR
ncbi:MAG: hypothetical protein HY666_01420 [Chloroflexi bacterium]|nr:hypothetical protein [Chloroflexota bacterium]